MITEDDLLNDLHLEYIALDRKPGEITVREWAEKYYDTGESGMQKAYKELKSYVPKKMTRRIGRDERGHTCDLYRLVPLTPCAQNGAVVE
jgi:hypothetical protein